MRIKPAGIGVTAFMFLVGMGCIVGAFFSDSPVFLLVIGGVWTAVAVFLAWLALAYRRRAKYLERLAQEGIRGEATILAADLTTTAVNWEPKGKLTVALRVPGAEPHEATLTTYIPRFAVPHLDERLTLPAWIDPDDRSRFAIQW